MENEVFKSEIFQNSWDIKKALEIGFDSLRGLNLHGKGELSEEQMRLLIQDFKTLSGILKGKTTGISLSHMDFPKDTELKQELQQAIGGLNLKTADFIKIRNCDIGELITTEKLHGLDRLTIDNCKATFLLQDSIKQDAELYKQGLSSNSRLKTVKFSNMLLESQMLSDFIKKISLDGLFIKNTPPAVPEAFEYDRFKNEIYCAAKGSDEFANQFMQSRKRQDCALCLTLNSPDDIPYLLEHDAILKNPRGSMVLALQENEALNGMLKKEDTWGLHKLMEKTQVNTIGRYFIADDGFTIVQRTKVQPPKKQEQPKQEKPEVIADIVQEQKIGWKQKLALWLQKVPVLKSAFQHWIEEQTNLLPPAQNQVTPRVSPTNQARDQFLKGLDPENTGAIIIPKEIQQHPQRDVDKNSNEMDR